MQDPPEAFNIAADDAEMETNDALQCFECDALLATETIDEGDQAKVLREDPESDKQASIDGNVKDVKRSAYVLEALRRATNTDSSD